MREEIGIFEDENTGFLRVRIPELREKGKRSPTFNLCTLEEFNKVKEEKKEKFKYRLANDLYNKKKEEREEKKKSKEVAELTEAHQHRVSEAIKEYEKKILPSKSKSTRIEFVQQFKYWEEKFGSFLLSELTPLAHSHAPVCKHLDAVINGIFPLFCRVKAGDDSLTQDNQVALILWYKLQ